jgi:hypothetical protein
MEYDERELQLQLTLVLDIWDRKVFICFTED